MSLFDSHTHFPEAAEESAADTPAILARAREAGLDGLLAVGGDAGANAAAARAAALAPGYALPAVGYGPDEADALTAPGDVERLLQRLREQMDSLAAAGTPVAAIGEIGLDYYREDTPERRARQRALFAAQLALARERALPCSIHSRAADADTIELLRGCADPDRARERTVGSLHCFVGDADFARALTPLGLCFGLSGIVTFRNAAALRAIVPTLPPDSLLVETDAPYLAPVPLRGRVNEPGFIVHTAQCLAGLLPELDVPALTTENARRVFRAR